MSDHRFCIEQPNGRSCFTGPLKLVYTYRIRFSSYAVCPVSKRSTLDSLLVPPGSKVNLKKDYDPTFRIQGLTKDDARNRLADGVKALAAFQDKLYAQDIYSVLIIFQAMDAAGKDGTIKHVMSGINPQGCQVYSFKAPNSEELDHDYLWRCFKALPERGRIGIFNRSYYEEVLIARIHPELLQKQKLPPRIITKNLWKERFEQINNFEKYLVDNGTSVIKFFLNVSREEQKRRFLERIDLPEKNWKFDPSDVEERQHWNEYIKAYEDCFNNTSTKWAPWHIVPADHKPTTRLLVAEIITNTLKELDLDYPTVTKQHKTDLLSAKQLLENE